MKVLVLGSDFGTIDMVKEAKKQGLYVVTTDLMETSPTKELSDEKWNISTTDIDTLEKKCKEENIEAILNGASDFNITCARKLCKRLNLPIYCESDYAWKVARDKSEFRKICERVNAPMAQSYHIDDKLSRDDLDKIKYPVIIKPVDRSGNKGMSYCNNEEELIVAYKYARSCSENETIICERQLHGPEWTVNYVLAEGEARMLYFSKEHHQPGELANLYSIMSTSSHHLKQYMTEMDEKVKKVFREANFKDGIAWVETMLDEDGHFYLIECGYRYGGDMSYASYERVCGFNSIKWMLDVALGKEHQKKDLPNDFSDVYDKSAVTYHLFALRDDVVDRVEGLDKIESLDNIIIDMPKRGGNKVYKDACLGTVRMSGTMEEIVYTIKFINENLRVFNPNNENIYLKFDDLEAITDDFNAGLAEYGRK